jgi:Prealbumin-like fold domain
MSLGSIRHRRVRRPWLIGLTLTAFALFAVIFVTASGANLTGSTFEGNDGNLVVDTVGHTDWANVAGLNVGIDDPSGATDNSFGQGTKEDDPNVTVVSGSIPPNKSDLIRFYEASELANNNVYLYLAWERSNVLGSANMDFEINQNATSGFSGTTTGDVTLNRTNGDVLVTFDFGGSGAPVLGILRWLADGAQNPDQTNHPGANTASECFSANKLPCWGDHLTLNSTNSEGAVNSITVTDPINPDAPRSLPANTFGEAAINLTGAGVVTASNGCQFGSATTFLKSRSSASFPAEVKDFVAPVATPIFNNCGAIKITKTSTKGGGLANASFRITGPNSFDQTFQTDSNGVICVASLPFGTYTVTETAAPSGYRIDNGSGVAANVNAAGSCPSSPTVTKSFTDTPLSQIEVKFTSLAGTGVTKAGISCTAAVNSEQGIAESSITSISAANPAVVTTSSAHGLSTGQKVGIFGSDSTPSIDGVRTVTVIDSTHFSVPVNVTTAGTKGTVVPLDDSDEVFGNATTNQLVPGTYTCTVVVDP